MTADKLVEDGDRLRAHAVTRLKRVKLGGLDLGDLRPGEWRELTQAEIREAFGCVATTAPRLTYSRYSFFFRPES